MVNKSSRNVESAVKPVSSIEKTLRNGAIAMVAAGALLGATPAKAQLATNTVNLAPAPVGLQWSDGDDLNPQVTSSTPGSQTYSAFNSSLGTLSSVTLSLSVSYNIQDAVQTPNEYSADDFTSLSPYLNSPFFSGSSSSGSISYGVYGTASQPYSDFYYDVVAGSQTLTQSGTFTYNLTLNSPSDLNAFLSSGTINYTLPDDSSPDAPFQILHQAGPSEVNDVNLSETVNGTLTEVYDTPEPSTMALATVGGAAMLFMLRRRRS
jgi:hypothetical protein